MAPDMDFKSLMMRVRVGDLTAAEEVVRRYEMAVRVAVRTRLLDPKVRQQLDSIDVCQSVMASFFVRAASGQYDLSDPAQLVALLSKMARNKLAMRVRHAYRARRDIRRSRPLGGDHPSPDAKAPEPLAQIADRELLRRAVGLMDAPTRAIADLRMEGRNWPDIAAQIGGPLSHVASSLRAPWIASPKHWVSIDMINHDSQANLSNCPDREDSFAAAMRSLRARPREAWLELARQDQCERWRAGCGIAVESYFAELPELRADTEDSLVLVCGEVHLRDELGEAPEEDEYFRRFPDLSDQLAIQFTLAPLLEDEAQRGDGPAELADAQADLASGGYQVVREIGRGASGVVYEAFQASVGRPVAVKCLAGALGSERGSIRLRQEAEILGRLRRSDVVQVYEVLERGNRVYLIMELVEGPTLSELSAGKPWEPVIASELVAALAGAVQAVHDAGVLHRDLKPSNVLTADDGSPKISDFGLAKFQANDSQLTSQGSILGTPSYMAPEQAAGEPSDVGVAADVYSLGAILYELLVGRPPFLGVTVLDTLSMIRDHEPLSPRQLQPKTPRDLETICLKCLSKRPGNRYRKASELAEDLRRFVRGESITARKPPLSERVVRSARRHKTLYRTGGLVIGSLIAGVSIAGWGLVREHAARQQAETASEVADQASTRSSQVAAFLKELLTSVDPSIALGQDPTMMRQVLERAEVRVAGGALGQPEVESEIKATIGGTYLRLGELDAAERLLQDALALHRGSPAPQADATSRLLNDLARVMINCGDPERYAEAEELLAEAIELGHEALGPNHPQTALSIYLRASLLYRRGELAEAEKLFRESLAIRRRALGENHQDVAASLSNLALALKDQGKLDDAESAIREAITVQKRALPSDHPDQAAATLNLAGVLSLQEEFAEAEVAARESLRVRRKIYVPDHSQILMAKIRLAGIVAKAGRGDEAVGLFEEALGGQRRKLDQDDAAIAATLDSFADGLALLGRDADAESRLREALAVREVSLGENHPDTLSSMYKLALLLEDRERHTEAIDMLERRLRLEQSRTTQNESRIGNTLATLARLQIAAGAFDDAEGRAREYLRLVEIKRPYKSPWFKHFAQSLVGAARLGQEDFVAAEPMLLEGYEGMLRTADTNLADVELRAREAAVWLAELFRKTGRPDLAAVWESKGGIPAESRHPQP